VSYGPLVTFVPSLSPRSEMNGEFKPKKPLCSARRHSPREISRHNGLCPHPGHERTRRILKGEVRDAVGYPPTPQNEGEIKPCSNDLFVDRIAVDEIDTELSVVPCIEALRCLVNFAISIVVQSPEVTPR
jgi:hypothetical protein